MTNKPRKTRGDCTVGAFEKKHGLPPGAIRNQDGRDTRSDKKIATIRKQKKFAELADQCEFCGRWVCKECATYRRQGNPFGYMCKACAKKYK